MGSKRKAEGDIGDEGKRSQRRQLDVDSSAAQQEPINPFAGVNITKVAGNTDDISSSARRLLSGAGSFVTTTTPAVSFAPKTPNNVPDTEEDSQVWEYRLNDIDYTFFHETLAKLEDHCQDWGPRADDFIRTVYNCRQASKGVKLPEASATTTEASSHSSKDNKSDQTPATASTPYTTTPAANITASTPATFGGFGSATFSPLAQPFTPAAASSSAQGDNYEDDAPDTQFQAAKVEGDVYTDILEVPKIVLFKQDASGYTKMSSLPVRVQSNTTSDVHHHRLIIREPSTGILRFNASITKDTPFTYEERPGKQPTGWIRFKARLSEEAGDEMFAIKASVPNAKMLHETLESIKQGML